MEFKMQNKQNQLIERISVREERLFIVIEKKKEIQNKV